MEILKKKKKMNLETFFKHYEISLRPGGVSIITSDFGPSPAIVNPLISSQ